MEMRNYRNDKQIDTEANITTYKQIRGPYGAMEKVIRNLKNRKDEPNEGNTLELYKVISNRNTFVDLY